jgi:hypothetical protein
MAVYRAIDKAVEMAIDRAVEIPIDLKGIKSSQEVTICRRVIFPMMYWFISREGARK